jgi:hypothetical protein
MVSMVIVIFKPLLLCRLSELLTIRATESGKTCHERWQDPTVSSYCACITHFGSSLGS